LRNKRRVFAVVGAAFLLWILFRSIPDDFWEPNETGKRRIAQFHSGTDEAGGAASRNYIGSWGEVAAGVDHPPPIKQEKAVAEGKPPPRPKGRKANEDLQYYDGEILFPKLTDSLHAIYRTGGSRKVNQNVLFVASNLKSLGSVFQLACAMAKRGTNHVHIAIFGRTDVSIEDLLKINGVDEQECKIYWHDARPNWAAYSSDFRAEASVASALEHIQDLMHPQVLITDDSSLEEGWFTRQVRAKSDKHEWPVIELPAEASEKLGWLARMDSAALKAFKRTSVDIVVQAPKGKAAGLLRLLRSLQEADYDGLPVPKLTVELPTEVEPMVRWHLERFKWPPHTSAFQPAQSSQLNIRHRIPAHTSSPEESSIRFMESFYPTDRKHSHVLVLNDNVELSPLFYHGLFYHILQYKYIQIGSLSDRLLGISLGMPKVYLNGTTAFEPPTSPAVSDADIQLPFLWQAPNPNAALIFGDKWVELHSFLQHRIVAAKKSKTVPEKVVGEQYPAWTEWVLELMQARGWSMLYPPHGKTFKPVAVVHEDLESFREEFEKEYRNSINKKAEDESDEKVLDKQALRGIEAHWKSPEPVLATTHQPLHVVLPFQDTQPKLHSLPNLLFEGTIVPTSVNSLLAVKYSKRFKETIGGCDAKEMVKAGMMKVVEGRADDLFCWKD
jgi:hypothetical protein